MQIPFVGFQPVQSSEHMAAFGVFGLCQLVALTQYIRSKLSKEYYDILFQTLVLFSGGLVLSAIVILTFIGSKSESQKIGLKPPKIRLIFAYFLPFQKSPHGQVDFTLFSILATRRITSPSLPPSLSINLQVGVHFTLIYSFLSFSFPLACTTASRT